MLGGDKDCQGTQGADSSIVVGKNYWKIVLFGVIFGNILKQMLKKTVFAPEMVPQALFFVKNMATIVVGKN